MRHRRVAGPIDYLANRFTIVSRPGLFAAFAGGAVLLGELLTAGISLLVVGQVRWTALVIGLAAGAVTSAAAAAILVRLLDRIGELQQRLEVAARTDELTAVFVDFNRFKRVNDRHGHQVGDTVLREAAAAIKAGLRTYDVVGRYGGEEFVMVLPDTGAGDGHAVAERIRQTVAAKVFAGEVRVTISTGVADLAKGMDADRLLKAADTAVYRAKRAGRNRSEVTAAQR